MSEITCSQCGAQNPTQSKYCNRCGASFVSDTTHICPACSTANPINLLYCDNCGTRLVDDTSPTSEHDDDAEADSERASRSKPFSLPSRPPGQTGSLDVSAELPDWLKTGDFSGGHAQDASEDEDLRWLRAAQEGEVWADDDAPTLEELSSDHAPQDDLPTWLLDEDTTGGIFSGGKSTDELFMGSSSADEESAVAPAEDPQPTDDNDATGELQSWLSEMEADDPGQSEADDDEAASLLASEADEPLTVAPSASPEMDEDDFLHWLSEIQEESDTDEDSGATAAPDVPSWLDQREHSSDLESLKSTETESLSTDAPEWLTSLEDDLVIGGAGDVFGKSEARTEEVDEPDWLVEPTLDDSERDSSATDPDTEPGEDKQEDDFLQWLDSLDTGKDEYEEVSQNDAATEPVETTSSSSQPPDADFTEADFALPEWLGNLAEPADSAAQQDRAEAGELPAWLQEISAPGDDITLPYVSGTEAEANEAALPQDVSGEFGEAAEAGRSEAAPEATEIELPDWITGVSAELSSPLSEQEEQEDQAHEFESSWFQADAEQEPRDGTSIDLDDQQVAKEDLPDWFSDVFAEIETTGDRQPSAFTASELANVPEQLAGADLPDWLDSPFADEEAAEPTPLEEIPEWLRAPLQEKLARTAEERGVSQANLDSGEEWRELLETPLSAEESSERRVHNPVPAWLESLRSTALSESGENEEVDNDEGNSVSPVAGIHGAIGIAPVVAQSAHRKRPLTIATSKEQEQQILLLRQLARSGTGETSVALSASSTTSPFPTLGRILLAVLLLTMVVLGLLAGDGWSDLLPSATADNSQPLMQNVLADAVGRPVLLVFDYTPAMAGALDPLAESLLQTLEGQDSLTLMTSQSASGLALAGRAANRSGMLLATDVGFIPGGALGVRQLARCMDVDSFCQSLFGQVIEDETARQLAATSAVVVITADRDSLLVWIEQLATIDSISLGAIVTPGLQPVAGPYLASGQLAQIAVANGLTGANQTSDAVTALGLTQLFVVAAMIAGAAFYLLQGLVRRRKV